MRPGHAGGPAKTLISEMAQLAGSALEDPAFPLQGSSGAGQRVVRPKLGAPLALAGAACCCAPHPMVQHQLAMVAGHDGLQ